MLPALVTCIRGLIRDKRVPRSARWVLIGALAWVVSPIDLIPEFLPVIGPIDDLLVAGLALRFLLRNTEPDVIRDHWVGSDQSLRRVLRVAAWPARLDLAL